MSDQISVGDLVVIVKPRRCGCSDSIGWVRSVHSIGINEKYLYCCRCGARTVEAKTATIAIFPNGHVCELSRLKKIPPLADPECVERKEELPA